jgi:nucleotidyltransferase/DNA polymerase involved in DNA repair
MADAAASRILYAEVPGFYAEVERRVDPARAGRPIVVGGDPAKRGKVQSASPEALAAGIDEGMSMLEALDRCPAATRFKTNMKAYREVSGALAICLRRTVDEIEQSGFGAAYAELHAPREAPSVLAGQMIETVRSELGLPLRIGLAPTKLVARLAAEESGPLALRVVAADEAAAFLAPLPVGRLTRVGRKTEATLAALGAARVGDLLSLDVVRLEAALGNHGLAILELARGNDPSPVRVARHPRSISRERKLAGEAPDDGRGLSDALRQLADALSASLERQGLRARRVALKLRFVDQTTLTRSATLGEPVLEAADIYGTAQSLLGRVEAGRDTIHTVGVVLAGLISAGQEEQQLELF